VLVPTTVPGRILPAYWHRVPASPFLIPHGITRLKAWAESTLTGNSGGRTTANANRWRGRLARLAWVCLRHEGLLAKVDKWALAPT